MAHADRDGSLQLLQNQDLFHIKAQQGNFRSINLKYWAWPCLLQLSHFISICFSIIYSQILTTGRLPLGEAIADHLVVIIAHLTLLGAQGMRVKVKSARHSGRHAVLLLIYSLGFLITGARAELQSNKADVQSCICAAPHAWEILDNALKAAAVTILAAMTIIGVAVVGRIINCQQPFPEIQAVDPEIPVIAAAVQALPIIPEVQGDDIDDVLARAPIPSRLNSPLSWL